MLHNHSLLNIVYSVEAGHFINELPEFQQLIELETSLLDKVLPFFIYKTKEDRKQAIELLIEGELLVDDHEFIHFTQGKKGECFYDYSLISDSSVYLYKELVSSFYVKAGEQDAIQMFKYQLEEHLVFETSMGENDIFFIDRSLSDLIIGLSKAYDIEVSFFDLDKLEKNL